jgi:hypothetical protein
MRIIAFMTEAVTVRDGLATRRCLIVYRVPAPAPNMYSTSPFHCGTSACRRHRARGHH